VGFKKEAAMDLSKPTLVQVCNKRMVSCAPKNSKARTFAPQAFANNKIFPNTVRRRNPYQRLDHAQVQEKERKGNVSVLMKNFGLIMYARINS